MLLKVCFSLTFRGKCQGLLRRQGFPRPQTKFWTSILFNINFLPWSSLVLPEIPVLSWMPTENNRKNREAKLIITNIGTNNVVLLLLASFNGDMSTLQSCHEMHLLYFQKARHYYIFRQGSVPRSSNFGKQFMLFFYRDI